jgi:2-keto-3-deoxy-L-rhamnonate aldolase RhmA
MTDVRPTFNDFRSRLQKREQMLGTFVKMPTTQAIEIIGSIGFDFVVIDQEHAPLGRDITDLMVLGARASNMAAIVRVGDPSEGHILSVLDCGATGIMVPHVNSAAKAREVARACRYKGGVRGFAGTTRAGLWGSISAAQHMAAQDSRITCIAMIEDLDAIDHVGEIARVEGIDALFIGRGDLSAALGSESPTSPEVTKVVERIAAQARDANIPLLVLASNKADALNMRKLGACSFLMGSDHGFILSAARAAAKELALPLA